jgi:hypothetical protein
MAYTIDTYSNSKSWKIEDGTVDQTTDLKLVGKNFAGYGEIQNENMVFLLENFAGQTEPPRKLTGQLWFDSGNSKLKFFDGIKWRTTGGAEVSSTVPTGLKEGDFWWDQDNEQLYTYNGGDFVLIGPQSAGSGQTQIVSRSVRDTGGTSRGIITAVVNDEVVFTVSSFDFTIDSQDVDSNIPGFDRIRQGITLKNTLDGSGGITSGDWRLVGTSTNSEKLGGKSASEYVVKTDANFSQLARFSDLGIAIGDSNDLKIKQEIITGNGTQVERPVISNETGGTIAFKAKNNSGVVVNSLQVLSNSVIPGFTNGTETQNKPSPTNTTLGTEQYPWESIFAKEYIGLGTASRGLILEDDVDSYVFDFTNGLEPPTTLLRKPSKSAAPNTVVVRDQDSDIYANYFQGIATEALYADLAEKYTTDEEYPVGTVMTVGGNAETTHATRGSIAIGVISLEPAYLMNKACEGQAIGLKGRVPVRVIGAVKKGEAVYVDDNGCASTAINGGCIVGIALVSSDVEEEKLVECVLKV